MFTGIVEIVGSVINVVHDGKSRRLTIAGPTFTGESGVSLGDSVAVNGVCLTVDALSADRFSADVMPETVSCTSLASLRRGSPVNLERSLPASGRFGGHIVSGHVDGLGTIAASEPDGNSVRLKIKASDALMELVVHKGSIAVDGVSLTVARVDADGFWVCLIPRTGEKTVLLHKEIGEAVNLECDILGKYVQKLLKAELAGKKDFH